MHPSLGGASEARPVTSSHIYIHIILITVTRMEVTVKLILDDVAAVAESAAGLREPIFVRIVSHVCRRSGQSSVRISINTSDEVMMDLQESHTELALV